MKKLGDCQRRQYYNMNHDIGGEKKKPPSYFDRDLHNTCLDGVLSFIMTSQQQFVGLVIIGQFFRLRIGSQF